MTTETGPGRGMTLTEAILGLGIAIDADLIADLGQLSPQQRAQAVEEFQRWCSTHGKALPPAYLCELITQQRRVEQGAVA